MTATEAVAVQATEVPFNPYDVRGLRNPYLGLRSYSHEQQAIFAGRQTKIDEAVASLTSPTPPTLLFVTGASGSGKSSFVMAGLLPALERHYRTLGLEPLTAITRPGSYPLAGLFDALLQLNLTDDFELDERLFATATTFADYLRTTTPPQQVNLLLLDQFEETFTQAEAGQRERLLDILANLPAFAEARTQVICTVRSDYVIALTQRPDLYEAAVGGVGLDRMSAAELSAAIRVPVVNSYPDRDVEPGLVERLTTEASADASLLPLLQVTLEELWDDGWLRLSEYVNQYENNIGYALRKKADAVYKYRDYAGMQEQERTPAEQQAMLTMLLDLVQVSLEDPTRDVRAQRTRPELTRDEALREGLVDDLAAARLLTTGRDARSGATLVSVTHESLIQHWPLLRQEINRRRGELEQRTRFSQGLAEWQGHGRSDEYLLNGVRLSEAMRMVATDDVVMQQPAARDYVQASREQAEAEQANLLRLAQEAAENARRAQAEAEKRAEAEAGRRELAEQALVAASEKMEAEQRVLSERAEKEAAQIRAEAAGRLLRSTWFFIIVLSSLLLVTVVATLISFSNADTAQQAVNRAYSLRLTIAAKDELQKADVRLALLLGYEALSRGDNDLSRAMLLQAVYQASNSISPLQAEASNYIISVRPDGSGLLTYFGGKDVFLLDAEGRQMATLQHEAAVTAAVFSPDGQRILTASADNRGRLWSIDGSPLVSLPHDAYVYSVAFSPDGTRLLTASSDNTAKLWDTAGKLLATMLHDSDVLSAVFSPDGTRLLTASGDNTAKLWDTNGKLLATLQHDSPVRSAVFSPDGDFMLSSTGANSYLWSKDGALLAKIAGRSFSFSWDSSRFLAADGNVVRTYPIRTGDLLKIAACRITGDFTPEELQQFSITQPRFDFSQRVCPPQFSWQQK